MQEWGDTEISEEKPGKTLFPPALSVIRGHIYRQEQVEFYIPGLYKWKMTIWNDLGKFICYFRDNPNCSDRSPVLIMGLPTTYDLGKGSILIDCMAISTEQYHSFRDFVRGVFRWTKDYVTKYERRHSKEDSNEED